MTTGILITFLLFQVTTVAAIPANVEIIVLTVPSCQLHTDWHGAIANIEFWPTIPLQQTPEVLNLGILTIDDAAKDIFHHTLSAFIPKVCGIAAVVP